MTQSASNSTQPLRSIETVMKQIGAASPLFELNEIRFIECSFAYALKKEDSHDALRIRISEQRMELNDKALQVSMLFEFLAPSPDKADPIDGMKQVSIRARLEVEYVPHGERGQINKDDAQVFGQVNGIYNAWPYLREYVQSSLVRLGLPPFELPLLRVDRAALLAGLIDRPNEASTTKVASS